jgi:uncharacterized protein (DUF2235 family)
MQQSNSPRETGSTFDDAPGEPRNLVICCDGTGNVWGNQHDTNVVDLVRWCAKDENQLVYYDPGVGTADMFPATGLAARVRYKLHMLAGLAFGRGIYENVAEAYEFLVYNYEDGDRIFVFGFSRGAFTARCVCGLVNLFGIIRPCAAPMMPALLRSYFSDPKGNRGQRERFAQDVRAHFTDDVGAEAEIHFIGVWDTVASVGGLQQAHISSLPSLKGKRFRYVRHALSAGEYRASYEPRLFHGKSQDEPYGAGEHFQPSLRQLWFPGAHSDVGGSYPEIGLSDGALEWMLEEAQAKGLRPSLDADDPLPDPRQKAHDQALVAPLWALVGLERRHDPDPSEWHPSLQQHLSVHGERAPIPLKSHPWLWRSILALVACYALVAWRSGVLQRGPSELLGFARATLLAPFVESSARAHYSPGVGWALLADVGVIIAYTCLLCLLTVYSIRRLRSFRPHSRSAHRRLRRLFAYPLRLLPIADLTENALALLFFGAPLSNPSPLLPWALFAASALKWGSLLLLLGLFAFAWLVGMRGEARDSESSPDARATA